MAMTKQEIFDRVSGHLLTQKRQSVDSNGNCTYRWKLPDGPVLSCAVGCLIPDNLYRPSFEGTGVSGLLRMVEPLRELLGMENEMLLRELQWLHDKEPVDYWKVKLSTLAAGLGLDSKVLDEFPDPT